MDTRENFTRTSLRLPQDLHDRLTDAAGGKRSLNAEIVARLEESLARERGATDGPDMQIIRRIVEQSVESVISSIGESSRLRGVFLGLAEAEEQKAPETLKDDTPAEPSRAPNDAQKRRALDL